jgi:hypothetical protein
MSRSASDSIVTPIQFLRLSLEDEIIVECRDNRVIRGVLHVCFLKLVTITEFLSKQTNSPLFLPSHPVSLSPIPSLLSIPALLHLL